MCTHTVSVENNKTTNTHNSSHLHTEELFHYLGLCHRSADLSALREGLLKSNDSGHSCFAFICDSPQGKPSLFQSISRRTPLIQPPCFCFTSPFYCFLPPSSSFFFFFLIKLHQSDKYYDLKGAESGTNSISDSCGKNESYL